MRIPACPIRRQGTSSDASPLDHIPTSQDITLLRGALPPHDNAAIAVPHRRPARAQRNQPRPASREQHAPQTRLWGGERERAVPCDRAPCRGGQLRACQYAGGCHHRRGAPQGSYTHHAPPATRSSCRSANTLSMSASSPRYSPDLDSCAEMQPRKRLALLTTQRVHWQTPKTTHGHGRGHRPCTCGMRYRP